MSRDWKEYVRSHLAPMELGAQREMDTVEELAQHLESVFDEARAGGASEEEAQQRACNHVRDWRLLECELILARQPGAAARVAGRELSRRPLPATGQVQRERRRRKAVMGSIAHDLRYGARMLRANKLFTAVAVLSLALGIGANAAIFSLINAVLLKMLPVKAPHELVLFNWICGPKGMQRSIDGSVKTDPVTGQRTSTSFSFLTFERFHDNSETLTHVFAFAPIEQLNVNVDGQAEIASGQLVSGDYHTGLGVPAVIGRTFTSGDDKPAADPVAVITYRYWQQRFDRNPEVIGKTVGVNNAGFTIIGVTPPDFHGTLQVGEVPDVSIPMSLEPLVRPGSASANEPWSWWLRIMGRLKPGVAREQARAELEGRFQQSALEGWEAAVARARARGQQVSADPRDVPNLRAESGSQGLNEARRTYAEPLTLLMIVVGLVLLIACANVANLLLSRAATRQKEIAVRLAMGASRRRIMQQLLTESVLLSAIGGVIGLLFAYWGKDMLLALRPWGGEEMVLELRLDPLVLAFTIAVSLITGILFGLAPALRSTRLDLAPALKDNSRSLVGKSRSGLTRTLIVVQVATSIVLLIGAGLFLRTLRNLKTIDVGFNKENLLLFRVDPGLSGLRGEQTLNLYGRLIERIESVPGVRAATISRHPLLSRSRRSSSLFVQGVTSDASTDDANINVVAPNFFQTMEIPILLGRGLSVRDDRAGQRVAVINQTMATKYFGDENPVGRRFGFSAANSGQIEIIGVVRDAKYTGLKEPPTSTVYTSYLQGEGEQMSFAVRTSGEPGALTNSIRDAVREVEPNLPMFDVQSQVDRAEAGLMQERLFASLSSFFGFLALALACIGLYAVMSYAVNRRTNEIGIRMALGARSFDVARMVMAETMTLVAIGVVIGLAAAIGTTRFIESMLFGLSATDPITIAMGVVLMLGVAALAGYLPARRAARVDPMTALRYE